MRAWTLIGDRTAFGSVRQLPPGHWMTVLGERGEARRYWSPPPVDPRAPSLDEDKAVDRFEELFGKAVNRQTMSDVKIVALLSGGIDSCAILDELARRHDDKLAGAYSLVFDDAASDESSHQQAFLKGQDIAHTSVNVCEDVLVSGFEEAVRHAETPVFRAAIVPMMLLARVISNDGFKVCLSGEGADEILLGYEVFREIGIRGFANRSARCDRLQLLTRLYRRFPEFADEGSAERSLAYYRRNPLDASDAFSMARPRWNDSAGIGSYLSDDVRASIGAAAPEQVIRKSLPPGFFELDPIRRMQMLELEMLLANYLLSSQGDRMAAASGVETRYPFLDNDLFNFAWTLPNKCKLRGLQHKRILRAAMKGRLPEAIRTRPKFPFQSANAKTAFGGPGALAFVDDAMSAESIADTGIFDPGQVASLRAKLRTDRHVPLDEADELAFFAILSTQIIHRSFVAHRSVQPPSERFSAYVAAA